MSSDTQSHIMQTVLPSSLLPWWLHRLEMKWITPPSTFNISISYVLFHLSPLSFLCQLCPSPPQLPDLSPLFSCSLVRCQQVCVCVCVCGEGACLWRKWLVIRASWWVSPSSGAPFIPVHKGPFTRCFSHLWTPKSPGHIPTLTHTYRGELSLSQDILHRYQNGHPDAYTHTHALLHSVAL